MIFALISTPSKFVEGKVIDGTTIHMNISILTKSSADTIFVLRVFKSLIQNNPIFGIFLPVVPRTSSKRRR